MVISNYKNIHFMISPLTAVKLRRFSKRKGTTMTDVIVTALTEYLDKENLKDEINQEEEY